VYDPTSTHSLLALFSLSWLNNNLLFHSRNLVLWFHLSWRSVFLHLNIIQRFQMNVFEKFVNNIWFIIISYKLDNWNLWFFLSTISLCGGFVHVHRFRFLFHVFRFTVG
jgi:hypothetical protein